MCFWDHKIKTLDSIRPDRFSDEAPQEYEQGFWKYDKLWLAFQIFLVDAK